MNIFLSNMELKFAITFTILTPNFKFNDLMYFILFRRKPRGKRNTRKIRNSTRIGKILTRYCNIISVPDPFHFDPFFTVHMENWFKDFKFNFLFEAVYTFYGLLLKASKLQSFSLCAFKISPGK